METPPTNACHRWHIYRLGSTRAINSSIRALLFTLCGRRIEPPPSPLLTPPPAVVSRATIGPRCESLSTLQFRVFNKSVLKGKGKLVLRHHVIGMHAHALPVYAHPFLSKHAQHTPFGSPDSHGLPALAAQLFVDCAPCATVNGVHPERTPSSFNVTLVPSEI